MQYCCRGGALTYESDVRVPPSTSDVGSFSDKLRQKIGAFRAKMAKNFSTFRQIFEKSNFLLKIVTCCDY